MKPAALPANESARLRSLHALGILDTAMEERFQRVTRLATHLFDVPMAAITLIDSERQWFKAVEGLPPDETRRDVAFCAHTVLQNSPLIVPDASCDERFHDNPSVLSDPRIRFYAGYPIRSPDGFPVGSLCVVDRNPRTLNDDQLLDLQDLAAMVENEFRSGHMVRVQKQMTHDLEQARLAALIDPLTRLWNRSGAEELLTRHQQLASKEGRNYHLLALDVDHFKKINDTYGHPVGDEVLKQLAKRIVRSIGPRDFACRFGGEEFLVLLDCDSSSEARDLAEGILKAVRGEPVRSLGCTVNPTLSIGMANALGQEASGWKSVFQAADQRLYQAKNTGRDRLVFEE
jgi:diguanylate cyclase (GGDEF)-like protein